MKTIRRNPVNSTELSFGHHCVSSFFLWPSSARLCMWCYVHRRFRVFKNNNTMHTWSFFHLQRLIKYYKLIALMGTWHAICSQYAAHLSLVNVMFNLEITYDCTATHTKKGSSSINSELFFRMNRTK